MTFYSKLVHYEQTLNEIKQKNKAEDCLTLSLDSIMLYLDYLPFALFISRADNVITKFLCPPVS